MSSQPQKGWNWSKQLVRCDKCGREGRRNNVEAHIKSEHTGSAVKVTIITPKDVIDIKSAFKKMERIHQSKAPQLNMILRCQNLTMTSLN